MVRGPVTLIVGLIYALMLSRPLATVFAIILPVLAIVLGVITYRVSPLYRQLQTSMDHLNGVVQEDLTAVRAVKAYVRTEHEEAKFDTVNTELARTATKTFGNAVLNLPVFQLSMYVAALSILWIGGRMILAGKLGVGSLTGFMSYVLLIMNSLMMISNVFLLLTRVLRVWAVSSRCSMRSLYRQPRGRPRDCGTSGRSIEFRDVPLNTARMHRGCARAYRPSHRERLDGGHPRRYGIGQELACAADCAPVRRYRGRRACGRT